jgi:hypothetical protein
MLIKEQEYFVFFRLPPHSYRALDNVYIYFQVCLFFFFFLVNVHGIKPLISSKLDVDYKFKPLDCILTHIDTDRVTIYYLDLFLILWI